MKLGFSQFSKRTQISILLVLGADYLSSSYWKEEKKNSPDFVTSLPVVIINLPYDFHLARLINIHRDLQPVLPGVRVDPN
ncbi:hypothetical protein RRG08_003160 [Elysia crispata]|uniref:Uncharacterized protein n=1 Tax=Elysia crispata TaxID=231223 RepID=A0AAE1B8C1_9GAST|nr:hypothetical protein RRG08_003160 [Elysia crispata]